jgi:hypothetical protein
MLKICLFCTLVMRNRLHQFCYFYTFEPAQHLKCQELTYVVMAALTSSSSLALVF